MILCSQLTFNRGVGYFNLTGQTTVEDQMINERAYIIMISLSMFFSTFDMDQLGKICQHH